MLPGCKEEIDVPSSFGADIRVKVYPNPVPANGQFTISIAHVVAVSGEAVLRDLYGTEAKAIPFTFPGSGTNLVPIPVSDLADGAYTIEVQVNDRKNLFSVLVKS
jgi:hypothetical protein